MKKSKWISSALLGKNKNIIHGFSTRLLGDASSVAQSNLLSKNLVSKQNILQLMNQQHGSEIEVIKKINRELPKVDSLVTNLSGIALGVRTADCVPILIYDPINKVIAAVHAGWRGAADHISKKTLAVMKDSYNTQASDCVVAVGPAIGECCFEVGVEVIDRFPSSCVGGGGHLDLPAAIISELTDEGVKRDMIDWLKICTSCDKESCYSHRRDKGTTGRHLALIFICDN